MRLEEIENILIKDNINKEERNISEELKRLKKEANSNGNEKEAKYIWCLETIYIIKNTFEKAFLDLQKNEFKEAWYKFDRCDIELGFLKKHFDYKKNEYNLLFIENEIPKYQKLFPYNLFTSRESIESDFTCSICGSKIGIRSKCKHKIGEIYQGKMCNRIIGKVELLAVAFVNNPVDKYTVVENGKENYVLLETLIKYIDSPYEKWGYDIVELNKKKYKKIGRNEKCPCFSGKKFKKCCIDKKGEHFKLYGENSKFTNNPMPIKTFSTKLD